MRGGSFLGVQVQRTDHELVFEDGEQDGLVVNLLERPILVGRHPTCDVVIAHDGVSRRHAAVRVECGRVVVQDLGSRNGTFVDGERVAGAVEAEPGCELRFGREVRALVRWTGRHRVVLPARDVVLEDVGTGLRYAVDAQPLRVGSAEDCEVRLTHGPPVAAIVVAQDDGREVWIGEADDMREVEVGSTVEIGGRSFRLHAIDDTDIETRSREVDPWPYTLEVDGAVAGGPAVRVQDGATGASYEARGTNRASLLYLLGSRWSEDGGVELRERGWVDDLELARGVWGRAGVARQLRVLVCRVRADLAKAGFDPWFVERRRGQLRIRVSGVTIKG